MIRSLAETKRILVCAGPGGVGKTTTAAAVGIIAARLGRRTLVTTIDPAPRLADALGVAALGDAPRSLPEATARALGIDTDGPGRLYAARLDTARAFRRLVEDQVADPEMRGRIFANPIYRQITSTLTGSQEYAATLALDELARASEYDLIVLDTPPTAHALDFLEAPRRIGEAIKSPAVQWFARPPPTSGRFSWQRLKAGPAVALRRMGKLVGSRFLDDLGAFLLDFRDVLDGFLARAQAVEALLRRSETGFLLVLSPEVPAVNEALYFSARLRSAGVPLCGFIANRLLTPGADGSPLAAAFPAGKDFVATSPAPPTSSELLRRLGNQPALAGLGPETIEQAARGLARVSDYVYRLAQSQQRELARLAHDAPGIDITPVPLLGHGVSNLDSLRSVADHLAGGPG
jgi:anion-transporting  ArsA/GET3 family ATPase